MNRAGGISRWTHAFAVASALGMVGLQTTYLLDWSIRAIGLFGLLGAVLPMTFGMAYLLLPAYVGTTLATPRLPGVHLVVSYAGAAVLVAGQLTTLPRPLVTVGATLWSLGVACFLAALGATIVPVLRADPSVVIRGRDHPQRSTRVATAVVPLAILYLAVGTIVLLTRMTSVQVVPGTTIPGIVHFYAVGFAALLIISLGARLLVGFFHVVPPRPLTWGALGGGVVAPDLIAGSLWTRPLFQMGAGVLAFGMLCYLGMIAIVAVRTDRRRIGLVGVLAGAFAGAGGVLVAATVVIDGGAAWLIEAYVPLVLDGFLLLTIIGYAYEFFPIGTGQFTGASERVGLATIGILGFGVVLRAVGPLLGAPVVGDVGATLGILGTSVFAYVLTRRLAGIHAS
ncbi:hypothetical protein [Natrinema sp. DC36]|uniref:hypothetical protein n=1 Tax=Natrinema sp. DC36 TaxID=2878680 RepID=UPI001CEFF604|nr:hypothetical protein [Natrinema sp. DC36]